MSADREQRRAQLLRLTVEANRRFREVDDRLDYLLDNGVTVEVPERFDPDPGSVAIATVRGALSDYSPMLVVWTDTTNGGCWFVPLLGVMLPADEVTVTSRAVVATEADWDVLLDTAEYLAKSGDARVVRKVIREWFAAKLEGGA